MSTRRTERIVGGLFILATVSSSLGFIPHYIEGSPDAASYLASGDALVAV